MCRMKGGIAKQVAEVFPEAEFEDSETIPGDKNKLGTIQIVNCPSDDEGNIYVINAYTQYDWWGDKSIDYKALQDCMREVRRNISFNFKIGIPKIGAGLAGGDWELILEIIEEELAGLDVTLVLYNK